MAPGCSEGGPLRHEFPQRAAAPSALGALDAVAWLHCLLLPLEGSLVPLNGQGDVRERFGVQPVAPSAPRRSRHVRQPPQLGLIHHRAVPWRTRSTPISHLTRTGIGGVTAWALAGHSVFVLHVVCRNRKNRKQDKQL